jgi:molecular chaperone GrpE
MSDETTQATAAHARKENEESESTVKVTDRRRVVDPDAVGEETAESGTTNDADASDWRETETLKLQLRERDAQVRRMRQQVEELDQKMRTEASELRARLERNFAQRVASARNELLLDLLAVFDNLDLVVEGVRRGGSLDDCVTGVSATQRLLVQALHRQGVERIEAVGQAFNPDLHEAIDAIEVAPERDGTVVDQMRAGYSVGGQLLRPAQVRVGRAPQ